MAEQIIIKQTRKNDDSFAATVQFGSDGSAYDITVTNPFTHDQESRLKWYFEQRLNVPFSNNAEANEAAASIRTYGETLFNQVFSSHPVVEDYGRIKQGECQIEIIGSPEFHALHWEVMHDPEHEHPLALEKPVIRKNSCEVTDRMNLRPDTQLRILLVTSRPGLDKDVGSRTLSRPLVEALEAEKIPAHIDMVRPGTFEALVNHLEDIFDEHGAGYYHIIHLDLKGALLTFEQYETLNDGEDQMLHLFRSGYAQAEIEAYAGHKAFFFFDDCESSDTGHGDPVSDDDLVRLISMQNIPILMLNACRSEARVGDTKASPGSHLLEAGARLVVDMGCSVSVTATQMLMQTFYRQLIEGKEPATAMCRGRQELYTQKQRMAAFDRSVDLEDWMLPVLYQNQALNITPETFQGQVPPETNDPPRPSGAFFGRDVDILKIEFCVLERRNILLLKGMGGSGKTTLLHHLGWWWRKTSFVDQVFYFGYDQKAHTLQDMITTMAGMLNLPLTGDADEDRGRVLSALKESRHLLVLDNLGSVTGDPLAIENTLSFDARDELKQFLKDLVRARTVVLLGSRFDAAWLKPDPLRDGDVYELPGLDYTAQTSLARAVINAVGAPHYPEMADHQVDFKRLLRVLGGHPLAMEVVLGDLAQNTPAELIEQLHMDRVNLNNPKETAGKTESIIMCVDCSHSNLSREIQALMLCLAPFTGVFHGAWKDFYTDHLKARPELADLPFDQWGTLLLETERRGLIKAHEHLGGMGYLSLPPVLPYFLKTRLNDPGMAQRKIAIETAFCDHYNGIGGQLAGMLRSKDPESRQTGQALIGLENENLLTAVTIGLENRSAFFPAFDGLSLVMIQRRNFSGLIKLCTWVLSHQARYTPDQLEGGLGADFLSVNDRLAGACLNTIDYDSAKKYYESGLSLTEQSKDPHVQKIGKADILHRLGIVAEKQGEWETATRYALEAAELFARYEDDHHLGMVLRSLARIFHETNDTTIPQTMGELMAQSRDDVEILLARIIQQEDWNLPDFHRFRLQG